jgi:hypothetical protein
VPERGALRPFCDRRYLHDFFGHQRSHGPIDSTRSNEARDEPARTLDAGRRVRKARGKLRDVRLQ